VSSAAALSWHGITSLRRVATLYIGVCSLAFV